MITKQNIFNSIIESDLKNSNYKKYTYKVDIDNAEYKFEFNTSNITTRYLDLNVLILENFDITKLIIRVQFGYNKKHGINAIFKYIENINLLQCCI